MRRRRLTIIVSSILASVWSLLPVYYTLIVSFSPEGMIPTKLGLPAQFTLWNWENVLFGGGMGELTFRADIWPYLRNSVVIATGVSILTLLISLPAAYTFSRYKSRTSKVVLLSLLFFRMIPSITLAIPLYLFMWQLGILGTEPSLIFGHLVYTVPLSAWLMKGFYDVLPVEIEEAALVDGASRFRLLAKIVLPLSRPGIAVSMMFSFLISYIEYLFAVILLKSATATIPVRLAFFISPHMILWRPLACTALLSALPTIVLFLFLQKHLVRGLTFGAVKG